MADNESIHGLSNPTGSSPNYGFGSEATQLHRKAHDKKLRAGEIVLGSIVGIPSPGEALISLPIGTLHAVIPGRLKQGDCLMFKVQETDPTLVLKIFSVSLKQGSKETPIPEIIRMLDLPETRFIHALVLFLSAKKTAILRDEVLIYAKYFDELSLAFDEGFEPDQVFGALNFFIESGIPPNKIAFERISLAFSSPQSISRMLQKLQDDTKSQPVQFNEKFAAFFGGAEISNNIYFLFNIMNEKEGVNSFYNLLCQSNDFIGARPQDKEWAGLRQTIRDLILAAEGQALANAVAGQKGLPLRFFILSRGEEGLRVAKLAVSGLDGRQPVQGALRFNVSAETKNMGKIRTSGSQTGASMKISFFSGEEKILQFLKLNKNGLIEKLNSPGFTTTELSIDFSGMSPKESAENPGGQQQVKISVVI